MQLRMWIHFLSSLGLLLLATFARAIDFEDESIDVENNVVQIETYEPVEPRERLVYVRPVPSEPTYFYEPFDTRAEFLKRWVRSQAKKDGAEDHVAKYDGQWAVDEPLHNPIERDLGLILKSEAKHHAIAARLNKTFEFNGKPLIIQYEVKFQSGMDCGGAYIKLLSKTKDFNLKTFTDQTPYTIMFGPDKCGNDNKLHFIFRHKNPITGVFEEKHAEKSPAKLDDFFTDRRTHLYTLMVSPDNTYEIRVDKKVVATGSLLTNFSPPVNPPEEVEDPEDLKPDDWDNREKIPDPFVQKPEDWDETEPATILDETAVIPDGWLEDEEIYIPDPAAAKPDDWDVETDGEWEAPHIDNPKCKSVPGCGKWERPSVPNPKYKGPWEAPMITNPDYRGEWKPRIIPNPHFFVDNNPYNMTPIEAVGLELWSMTSNIIFDNFIIADNATVVDKFTAITWELKNIEEIKQYSSLGLWSAIRSSTDQHPWLWIVYSIFLAVPIILVMLCLCPRSGSVKPIGVGDRKKFDYPMPDVRDVIMEEEEAALKEENEVAIISKGAVDAKNVGGWGPAEIGTAAIAKKPLDNQLTVKKRKGHE